MAMTYHRPENLAEALRLVNVGTRILAGGTDLFPATQNSQLRGEILDITAVAELGGIRKTTDGWRIGATATWSTVINADLPPAFDALKQAAREVGSIQIQNSATVAGNLCNASPAADGVPPLLALDAQVEVSSPTKVRVVPLRDFITGVRQVDLGAGEMVTAVLVPAGIASGCSAFIKLGARKYLVISVAMVAVWLEIDAGIITAAQVSVGACSPVATRLPQLEAALIGCDPTQPNLWAKTLHSSLKHDLNPIADIRADADYRMHAAEQLINRAIAQAAR